MILQATHTHLYPGHRGRVAGLASLAELHDARDCLVEFADGSATPARLSRAASDWQLDTGAYRTTAGTEIPAKRWRLRLEQKRDQVNFRILNRSSGG